MMILDLLALLPEIGMFTGPLQPAWKRVRAKLPHGPRPERQGIAHRIAHRIRPRLGHHVHHHVPVHRRQKRHDHRRAAETPVSGALDLIDDFKIARQK